MFIFSVLTLYKFNLKTEDYQQNVSLFTPKKQLQIIEWFCQVREYFKSYTAHVDENYKIFLARLFQTKLHALLGDYRGKGLFLVIEFVKTKPTNEPIPPYHLNAILERIKVSIFLK